MSPRRRGRVFVGVDGSLASLRALRQAVAEARWRGVELYVVHVRPPARPTGYEAGLIGYLAELQQPDELLDRQAEQLIATCIEEGLGGAPADVSVHPTVTTGRPGRALVSLAWRDDDLIVVGTGERGRLRHPLRCSVSRYCLDHARCLVLVVPPDSFARTVRHGTRFGGSLLRGDLWKLFDATVTSDGQRTG